MTHSKPILSAIAAMAENRVIGQDNQLPWRLPADLAHFKTLTTGHPVLMGRKTYKSIGRPLPNRTNIILTRDPDFSAPDCIVVTSAETAVTMAIEIDQEEVFIIGGAEIYQQLLPKIQKLYLTLVHHPFKGDAYFPELPASEWQEISREKHSKDDKNEYDYSFVVMKRV